MAKGKVRAKERPKPPSRDPQARAEAAKEEIVSVLAKHRCDLRAIVVWSPDGRLLAHPQIVALPDP